MTRPAPEPLRIRAGRAFTPTEVIPDAAVLVEDGRIAAVGPDARVPSPPGVTALDAGDRILAPGFIDLHVHGRAGHACGASAAETLAVAAALPATGVTSFLATVAGQPDLDALLRALAAAAEARGREGTGARVLG
ncbi:MAG TPA: amidohydrolase family protein, partial [Dehalococcoidia bacterium]